MGAERKEMSREANKDAVVKAWVSTPYLSHPLHSYSVQDANECGRTAQDPGVYWVPHRRRCCSKPQRSSTLSLPCHYWLYLVSWRSIRT